MTERETAEMLRRAVLESKYEVKSLGYKSKDSHILLLETLAGDKFEITVTDWRFASESGR